MEAPYIASFLEDSVNALRRRKDKAEPRYWQPLYERSLEKCIEACDNDLRTLDTTTKHGFRQTISRVIFKRRNQKSTKAQILSSWVRYRANLWQAYSDHDFASFAVLLSGNRAYVTYTVTTSVTHPCMRWVRRPKSILKPPRCAAERRTSGLFTRKNLVLISESAHVHMNVELLPLGCSLIYDEHLQRLAEYYAREGRDFGVMDPGNCRMARTVFEVDVRGVRLEKVGEVVAREILGRLSVERGCRGCCGGIGVVAGEGTLWVGVVCYARGVHRGR